MRLPFFYSWFLSVGFDCHRGMVLSRDPEVLLLVFAFRLCLYPAHPDPHRAHRNPKLPVELSGVFALRAATRYRLQ